MVRALTIHFMPMMELCSHMKTVHSTEVEQRILTSTTDAFFMQRERKHKAEGAERMDKIIRLCTSLPGYVLSYFQLQCLYLMLACFAPIIFKGCSPQEMAAWMKKNSMVIDTMFAVFFETSRRSGKTDIIAIFTAAMLLVVPFLTMLAWSLHNDTSELFGQTIVAFAKDMGGEHRVRGSKTKVTVWSESDRRDQRSIRLHGSKNPNVSLFFFHLSIYPSIYPPPFILFSFMILSR
jgi:hypothetical protein